MDQTLTLRLTKILYDDISHFQTEIKGVRTLD